MALFMNKYNFSVEDSIKKLIEILSEKELEFENYAKILLQSTGVTENMRIFIENLELMVGGNVYVETYLDRYINAYKLDEQIFNNDK